jgi:hypothetical protein
VHSQPRANYGNTVAKFSDKTIAPAESHRLSIRPNVLAACFPSP